MAPSHTNPITNFTKALKSSLHFIVYAVWEIIVCTKIAIKHSKNNPNQKDKERPLCFSAGHFLVYSVEITYICSYSRTEHFMEKFIPHHIDHQHSFTQDMLGSVKAGFPSPAEDMREQLDLIKLLVRHKASTFFFRVSGVSMVDAAMDEGDILIVDRAIDPYNNCKAVCYIDGEYTVKRVEIGTNSVRLMPANDQNTTYKPIEITPENEFAIWGVVTYVIKKM